MQLYKVIIKFATIAILLPDLSFGSAINAEIGEPCTTDSDCHAGPSGEMSLCYLVTNTCICTVDAIFDPSENPIVCRRAAEYVGDPCERDSQCQANLGALTTCRMNTCVCASEAVTSSDGRRCLPIINEIGGPCQENVQCQAGVPGELSICINSLCNCTSGATTRPGEHKCYKAEEPNGTLIGRQCSATAECVGIPNFTSICSTVCQCSDNYIPSTKNDDCLEIQNELGEPCRESQQCQVGTPGELSVCRDGTCQCTDQAINPAMESTCYRKATYVGDRCDKHVQCYVNLEYSFCLNERCVCNEDAVESREKDKCILRSQLNGQCEKDGNCQSPSAHL